MNKRFRFPFTTNGAAQWRQWLAGLSPVQRHAEAQQVLQGLKGFLPHRFELDAEQLAFLDSLQDALCALWATQLAYAIDEQLPIALVKPERRPTDDESAKFIEVAIRTRSMAALAAAMDREDEVDNGDYLTFTIHYR